MILSRMDLETIAVGILNDFNRSFSNFPENSEGVPHPTPIDQFAKEYLGLDVSYRQLSTDGRFCGLTAYTDTEYLLNIQGKIQRIPLKQNQVILDSSFIEDGYVQKRSGKRRFTLAHECAHQILYQLAYDSDKKACQNMYACRTAYTVRELKSREDWNEWQANTLGSAILMPWKEIKTALEQNHIRCPIKCYQGHYPYFDQAALDTLCRIFGTSKTAMAIRLEQLGYLKHLPRFEFHAPVEVYV